PLLLRRCAASAPLHGLGPSSPSSSSRPSLAQVTRTGGDDKPASLSAWWRRRQDGGGARVLPPEAAQRLGQELAQYAAELQPSQELLSQKDEFLKRLQGHLVQIIDGADLSPFGSVVNGFWTPTSDVDVCVRVPGASTRNAQIQVLRQISAELTKAKTHYVEARFGAQVPILHWAPLRPGMVSCDISVNNVLAVVNSRLVGHYVRLDDRVRTLGLCIKAWAAARRINDRSRGTISSFALVLMLIHFLQRRDPPVLPSLQDIAFSQNEKPKFVNGVDCRFCTDAGKIREELAYLRGARAPNEEDAATLLLEFFRYFGKDYRSGIIRIRDTRSMLPPGDETKCFLVVDNPFEVGKDVANIDASQQSALRKEFRRAWSYLNQGRSFSDLLQDPEKDG
ncbi:URT1, partial [Symbiodinium microadriaticum]